MEGKFSEKDHHISRRNKPHGLQLKKKMEIKPSFRNDNVKRKSIRSALNDNYTKSYSRKKDAEKCVGDSRGKFANIDKIKGSSLNRGSSSKSLKTANISKSGLNYKTTLGDISAAKDRHTHGSKKSSISKSMKDKYNSERDIVQKPYKHFNRSSEKSDRKTSNSNNDSSFFKSDRKTLSPSLERGEAANPERHLSRSLEKTSQKSRKSTVSSDDDSILTDDRPRKIKRVMRIHPDDISNKRIDDSPPSVEKNVPKDVKPSLNAQFRAIKPNPELLSFVEDNLLGRRRMVDIRRAGYNVDLSVPLDNIPFSESSERSRIENNVFRNKLTFFAAAKVSSSFPPADLPEIAFAGRSNVGKSSLLNALTRQWGVVRTSDKPGLTQTINFFNLGSKLCLVDLPGYGFAYAKEEVRDTWEELVQEYVSTRVGLKRVCLLIDTKWGIKPRDYDLINLMERSQTQYQIVLTKSDMVFPMDVARRATQIQENLKENKSVINPLMMVSSKSGAGIRSLRTVLTKLARFIKP